MGRRKGGGEGVLKGVGENRGLTSPNVHAGAAEGGE